MQVVFKNFSKKKTENFTMFQKVSEMIVSEVFQSFACSKNLLNTFSQKVIVKKVFVFYVWWLFCITQYFVYICRNFMELFLRKVKRCQNRQN